LNEDNAIAPERDASGTYSQSQWSRALARLQKLLEQNAGSVSSKVVMRALRAELPSVDPYALISGLKFADPEDLKARGFDVPQQPIRHAGRSFYTEQKYEDLVNNVEDEVERKVVKVSDSEVLAPVERPESQTREYRQEEVRLTSYVKKALENLYSSDFIDEEVEYVFDVHADRPGSHYENVDVLAVHWRSAQLVELISIEVKLQFTAQAIQQAINYQRFSDRVWIAIPTSGGPEYAAEELRERDPQLFDYVVSHGIGILACHRARGRSYNVFPIHWPRRSDPDPFERGLFTERYRTYLEDGGILEPSAKRVFPVMR
jgi:hypothetical protein